MRTLIDFTDPGTQVFTGWVSLWTGLHELSCRPLQREVDRVFLWLSCPKRPGLLSGRKGKGAPVEMCRASPAVYRIRWTRLCLSWALATVHGAWSDRYWLMARKQFQMASSPRCG